MELLGVEPVPPFANHLPVRIRFGEGVGATVPEVLRGEAVRRVLAVVDEAVLDLAPLEEFLAGPDTTRWVKGPGEPTVDDVEAAARGLLEAEADAVVAVGGGSSMDVAKAARAVAGQGTTYRELASGAAGFEPPRIPLVCVPTTAGTGSEVSGGAVITDPRTGRKAGIANPLMRAQHALVDPELTYGLPPEPTLYTGVDALAQAISASVVTVRTPVGTAIGLEAVRLAADALPAVVANGVDRHARNRMACASLMAGLAMNISDCGSEHSIAQALGGRYHLPHGLTIGLVLAETIDHDRHAVPELFERVADALGEPDDGSGDGSRAVRAVQRLLAELDFPTLSEFGVADEDLDHLADAALADNFIAVAPHPWTRADVLHCYQTALGVLERTPA